MPYYVYENGTMVAYHQPATTLNLETIIAPIILIYEFMLITYSSKIRRLREVLKPALGLFFLTVKEKKLEGIAITREYLERKK